MRHPEETLLLQIASGDKDALSQLYSITKTSVYGLALSIVRNKSDAEDVMQDTYVKIFTSAKDYQPMGTPMAWILTIVRNLSLMKLRVAKKVDIIPDIDPEDMKNPVEDTLNRLVLRTAMEVLSEDERQIVILHAIGGQKHREIAALLQIPLSTTLSKYRRALSKIKYVLKEDA